MKANVASPSAGRLVRSLLLLLALVGPLEGYLHYRWRQMMRQPTETYLRSLAALSREQTRVLIVGDSHPHNAFPDGTLPDSITSVAFGNDGLRDTELKLRHSIERGIMPQYLILEADDHVAGVAREPVNNEQLLVLGTTRATYNAVYGRSISGLKHWTLQYAPLTDVRNRSFLFLALSEQIQRRLGTLHPPMLRPKDGKTWATSSAAERARIVENRRLSLLGRDYALSATLRASWARIRALCRAHGIRIIGVRYPLTPEYLAAEARCYNLQPMRAMLTALPPDTLLDYTHLFIKNPTFFNDADHLSTAGGQAFAPRFLNDLRAIRQVIPPVLLAESRRRASQ